MAKWQCPKCGAKDFEFYPATNTFSCNKCKLTQLGKVKESDDPAEVARRSHMFFIAMVADEIYSKPKPWTALEEKIYTLCVQHLELTAELKMSHIQEFKKGLDREPNK